jgi:serine protease Do
MAKWCALLVVLAVAPAARAEDEKGWLGVQVKLEDGKIVVMAALPDSPAEKAKLKEGDIITKVGDNEPGDLQTFVQGIGNHKPGEKVKLTILRDGKEMKIEVELGKRPADLM